MIPVLPRGRPLEATLAEAGFLERRWHLEPVFEEAGKLPTAREITTTLRPEQRLGAERAAKPGVIR